MEEMNELFYRDTYCREFSAEVLSCTGNPDGNYTVVLGDTAFYPEGGGQPCDLGTMETEDGRVLHVLDVHRNKQGEIGHTVDGPVAAGSTVKGSIDWERRFDHMQQHSGEHIFSGLLHEKFGCDNVGFHLGEEVMTLDFDRKMTMEDVLEVEHRANAVVWSDREVKIDFPDPEELKTIPYRSKKELTGKVRIVTMPDSDICACCGTHVRRTGEIGMIKVLSLINYKSGVRIELVCGRRALKASDAQTARERELMKLLAAEKETIVPKVAAVLEESLLKDKKLADKDMQYCREKAANLTSDGKFLMLFEEGRNPAETRRFCELLLSMDKAENVAVLSAETAEDGTVKSYIYVIGSRSTDVRPGGKEANGLLNGRGGGSAAMVQGRFSAERDRIEAELNRIFG